MLDKVREIAEGVREWAEGKQKKYQFLYSLDLCGLCAKASAELHDRLTAAGIKAKLCYNNKHCFVKYEDYIVDVTATQFSVKEKVFITKHEDALILRFGEKWRVDEFFDSSKDLSLFQKKEGWVSHQIASLEALEENSPDS